MNTVKKIIDTTSKSNDDETTWDKVIEDIAKNEKERKALMEIIDNLFDNFVKMDTLPNIEKTCILATSQYIEAWMDKKTKINMKSTKGQKVRIIKKGGILTTKTNSKMYIFPDIFIEMLEAGQNRKPKWSDIYRVSDEEFRKKNENNVAINHTGKHHRNKYVNIPQHASTR